LKRSSLEALDLNLKESIIALLLAILPSAIKVRIYKLCGARIGRGVKIGFGSVVMAEKFSKIDIGDYTAIRNFTVIICREVNIGKYVEIAMFIWIWGAGKLTIRNKCYFGSRINVNLRRNNFYCGEFTGLAAGVVIYTHSYFWPYTQGWYHILKDVILEDHVMVGMNSIILPGVIIGENSIIGAGSVVSRPIPPNSFAAGNPAKVISSTDKFKDEVDSKELTRRSITIARDLVDYFGFKLVSERNYKDVYMIAFERSTLLSKKVWWIIVADASILHQNRMYRSFRGNNLILFSTSHVTSKISQRIPLWYDLKNLKCSYLPDRFSIDIWHFLYYTWCVVCDVKSFSCS